MRLSHAYPTVKFLMLYPTALHQNLEDPFLFAVVPVAAVYPSANIGELPNAMLYTMSPLTFEHGIVLDVDITSRTMVLALLKVP